MPSAWLIQHHFANSAQKITVPNLIICRDDGRRKVTFILKSSNFHVIIEGDDN
jgi:hypothetical protein